MKKILKCVLFYALCFIAIILALSEGNVLSNIAGLWLGTACIVYLVSLDHEGVMDLLGLNWLHKIIKDDRLFEDLRHE